MSGLTDIPTSFGFPAIIRIILPGFVFTVLFSCAIIPNIAPITWSSLTLETKLIFWTICGMIFGLILTSADFYIYQFFEGLRFWPKGVLKWKYNHTLSEFRKEHTKYRTLNKKLNEGPLDENFDFIAEQSKVGYKIREYPYNPQKKYFSQRYPECPTRLGNVMAEYETYSEKQYGISMAAFWQHLWFVAPNEIRDFLDEKGAIADFFVYLTFIFLIYSPFAAFGFTYQIMNLVTIYQYANFFIGWPNVHHALIATTIFLMIILISITLSYLFYIISVSSLVIYGKYVKALVDFYRIDFAEKLGVEIMLIPDQKEMDMWMNYGDFLIDYIKNQTPIFPPQEGKRGNATTIQAKIEKFVLTAQMSPINENLAEEECADMDATTKK